MFLIIFLIGGGYLWAKAKSLMLGLLLVAFMATSARAIPPIPPDNFRPAATYSDYYQTYTPVTLGVEKISFRVMYDFAHNALELQDLSTGARNTLVAGRHTVQLLGAVSLRSWLQLEVAVPFVVHQDEENLDLIGAPGETLNGGIGDIRVAVKGEIWRKDWFHLGAILPIQIGSGSVENFRGRGTMLLAPGVAAEGRFERFSVAVNTGMMLSNTEDVQATPAQAIEQDIVWYGSVGGKAHLIKDRLDFVSDLFGTVALEAGGPGQHNLEWLNGLRGRLWRGLFAEGAFGVGLADGTGTPAARGLVSIGYDFSWTPTPEPRKKPCPSTLVPVPVEVPTPVIVPLPSPVFFPFDKAHLTTEAKATIDVNLAKFAVAHASGFTAEVVVLVARADRRGSDGYNQTLSERRAESVKAYLIEKGVEPHLVNIVAQGEDESDQETTDAVELQLDRVVFMIPQ
jgi:OOP family OmpA-OmpF porin